MEPSENYDVPTEVECKLLKHKYLKDRKSEINKELKNIRIELKSVTRFLNYKARLQISEINAQAKPTSSSSVPSQIKNDTMVLENDLSQSLAPKVPNKKRSRNKAKSFVTNKNQNTQKSVTQNSSNDVNIISDQNLHHIESSRLKNKYKKNSNVNINKNSQTNTIQKTSDSVIVVLNNHSNMVSTSQHTTQATDDCGHHIEDTTTPSLQPGNDVCVFHDILARCMTIRNLIYPVLQSHCDPPHSQPGTTNGQRHANSHCGLKQTNFCVNTRGKGKKNTIINWYMNWKRNMYRRPMRGSITRGSGSRGRGLGKGRGHNSAFGRGNHHFRPYFDRQTCNNYVSHPEKQDVHPNMNPVNYSLEDETENNLIEVKDSHVKNPPDQNKNNELSKFISSEKNSKNNNQKSEKTKTIPQTSSESSNYYHIRKKLNKNSNKSDRRGLKNGLVENGTKEKTKNKIKQTKHQETSCSSANNSPVHRGIKKHQVCPVYIPSRRGFRTRGQRPWPAQVPYHRPPFYRQFHDFPKNNKNLCDKNVKTTGDVTTSDVPKPTEKTTSDKQTSTEISTTISHLPNTVTTSEVMNDYQDNIDTEEIQENPKNLKEKSPEVNEKSTDDSESCLVTNDINTTSVPVSTEHAINLTMIGNIPDETNEANIPEENTETITESNKTDITKSSNAFTKKCVVVAAFEYDDDTSQSNTRVLLNNLNNMEPALKSLLLTVKNQETTKIENFPVKVESTIVKEECFAVTDSYSSVDVDTTERSTYNHQHIKSEFIENIHMKDIKIEKKEIPDDTENYNVLHMSPNEFESNLCYHDRDPIDDIEATDNITNTINRSPIQTPINISTSPKQNFNIDGEIRNQTIGFDYDYIKTILKNIRSISPEKLKSNSEFDGFYNAEVIAATSTNTLVANEKQNENKDNYNIISMEIDDDDNTDSDATELLDNLSNISDSDSQAENVTIQDIESDIVEIIDIIKTNPTDFETLLSVISSGGTETDNMLLNDIATAIGDILKNSSSHSLKSTMSKERVVGKRVSGKMSKRQRRKRRLKTQQSIQKLFHQLRDASHVDSQLENSATNSQDSSQASIIDLDDSNITMIPNELRNNLQTNDNSVLILDGEQACSTPKRGSLQNLQKPATVETIVVEDVVLAQSNNRSLNETRMINRSSFQTIDLTTDSGFNRTERSQPTVIEISDACDDVTLMSAASSMSGDSDVTVLRQPISRKLKKFTNGIASLNADEKGKLLELITQTIFNGCDVQSTGKQGVANLQRSVGRAAQTAEDTYIKEVILGSKASRSSIGSNIYHPDRQKGAKTGPKMIVIDGSNVAMEHGRGQYFSVRGLQICIDYFLRRGHVVKAFVPRFRCKNGKSSHPRLLDFLERKGLVIYTPSREVLGRTITPYDDRYIIQCAAEFDAVVVSCDNYRDLAGENPRWRSVINTSVLPFTWVDDMIMFPRDPLGRHGPTLEQFLRHPGPEHAVRIN